MGDNSDVMPVWTFERDCIVAAMMEGMRPPTFINDWCLGAKCLVISSPLKYVYDGCQCAGIPLK